MKAMSQAEIDAIIKQNEANLHSSARARRIKMNLDEDYNYKHYYDTIEVEGKGIRWALKDESDQDYVKFLRDRERM